MKVSLSARRAWIEILGGFYISISNAAVALRKESVDRNFYYANKDCDWVRSLSARRAWIEIFITCTPVYFVCVALRKESVDRNADGVVSGSADYGRSPQGERG